MPKRRLLLIRCRLKVIKPKAYRMVGDDSKQLRSVLARNIRLRRTALGFSQEALADLCGLHRTYIGSVERAERNVSIDNIEKLAAALQVSAADLLSGGGK